MESGVYQILNKITNEFYIGSSCKLQRRKYTHFYQLKENIHNNKYLQNAYNKYKEENFKFIILANCPKEYCIKLEQWFIDNMKPKYNHLKKAGNSLGYKHTSESIEKLKKQDKMYSSKKLYQYDTDNNFLKEWNSCSEFGRYYNISRTAIIKAIKKSHKCKGFIISYNSLTLC